MCTRCTFVVGLGAAFATPAIALAARTGDPKDLEIAFPGMRRFSNTMWLGRLTPAVWIHTITHDLGRGEYYPGNGAIVVHDGAATLIDTGWSDEDAESLLRAWSGTGEPAITQALATHFHMDRVGGIGALAKRGIPTYGNPLTIGLALENGHPVPRPLHDLEKRPQTLGGMEIFYPGAGHTIDNVVAWIPRERVLFGGCLVKATSAPDLGYLADAKVATYPETMRAVIQRYAPNHVIPGHGTIAGDSLAHSLAMASALTHAGA